MRSGPRKHACIKYQEFATLLTKRPGFERRICSSVLLLTLALPSPTCLAHAHTPQSAVDFIAGQDHNESETSEKSVILNIAAQAISSAGNFFCLHVADREC